MCIEYMNFKKRFIIGVLGANKLQILTIIWSQTELL